ncbi:hypothetical protein K439DRAFT_151896 [Ramaria rubella]|nr:hypothetical protein K439DRAFT_151896 [Ramaria rubella]
MSPKSIIVFCDGTGMDGNLTDPKDGPTGGDEQRPTNVVLLCDNGSQIVFYQSGTGSLANFDGQSITEDVSLKLYGIAVASKIREAYVFIAQNYVPGDDICLFGFSRGAYTARKDRIGLLGREDLSKFFTYWLQLWKEEIPGPPHPSKPIPIKCVVVWDTVGSVFTRILNPIVDALSIKDTSLGPNIEVALHALAMQENRENFMCTLWTIPPNGLSPGQTLKQQWFPGAHSNVGGSYENHELSDLALFWIAGEISSFISVDLDYIKRCRQPHPTADWGSHQPVNAWEESVIPFDPAEDRLAGGQIFKDSDFHLSVFYAPLRLDHPKNMITLHDLDVKFGDQWEPDYQELNDFEQICKNEWRNPILGAPVHDGTIPFVTAAGFMQAVSNDNRFSKTN